MSAAVTGGPPKCERPAPPQDRHPHRITDTAESNRYVAALKRRRAAAQRLPVLDCGRSDPWHHTTVPMSAHQAEAWQRTVAHLIAAGFKPIIPAGVLDGLK